MKVSLFSDGLIEHTVALSQNSSLGLGGLQTSDQSPFSAGLSSFTKYRKFMGTANTNEQ